MKLQIANIKFLVLRRIVQASIAGLFIGSNYLGWQVLKGDYSAASLINTIPVADPLAVLQILISGFWVGTKVLIGASISLLLYGLFFGRAFCSWVCPINPLNDLAAFAGKEINKNKHLSALINKNTRYWVLALALVLSVILQIAAFEIVSPIGIVSRAVIFGIGNSWALLIAFFLFEFAVVKNGWCGRLCPLGAFYALTGKFRLVRIRHNVDKCTKCNDCFKVCPEKHVLNIITVRSGTINNSECTNCGRCVEVCNYKALNFGLKTLKK